MTALRPTDARVVAGLFPETGAVGILDARADPPIWADAFPRTWATDGVVLVPRTVPPTDGPVVAILPTGPVGGAARDALAPVAGQPFRTLASEGESLLRTGQPLPKPPFARRPAIRLAIEGAGRIEVTTASFPVSVSVVVPAAPVYRLLRIGALPGIANLPSEEWFHLDLPPGPAELRIDVTPQRGGDRWTIRRGGREVGSPAATPEPTPVRRVILVFDRTTPDRHQWSAARALVRDQPTGEPVLSEFLSPGSAPLAARPATPARPAQAELNASIRAGLIDGFRTAFDSGTEVELVWFADLPGKIGCPPGVVLPRAAVGRGDRKRCPATELAGPLAAAGYSPGMDLWDALEEALREAARIGANGPAAVLIVGNSPPRPPSHPDHPFARLWRERLSPSTVRERGAFPEALDALSAVGPVLTIFLAGHDLPVIGADGYQTVQAGVHDAFAEVLPVIEAVADREGVAKAVAVAARQLSRWVSGVLVREGGR